MPEIVNALESLRGMPGVPEAIEATREACTAVRWHPALRRRIPEAAAESRVRGARASALLEGASLPVDRVRAVFAGAASWPAEPDPVETVVAAAMRATAQTESLRTMVRTSPAQVLARLHVAATGSGAAGAVGHSASAGAAVPETAAVGRPRVIGETSRELTEIGPVPDAAEANARLRQVQELVQQSAGLPDLLVAAVVHAEIATVRPFVAGNGLVARAFERCLLWGGGLDPTGVVVPEAGHTREGSTGYVGALSAYANGGADGVRLWILHCAAAYQAGANEAVAICDAVLAGRLT